MSLPTRRDCRESCWAVALVPRDAQPQQPEARPGTWPSAARWREESWWPRSPCTCRARGTGASPCTDLAVPAIASAEPRWLGLLAAICLVAEGKDRYLDTVLQAEFGEDAADVGLDGLLADRQVPADLPVAATAGEQAEHFAFAR